MLVCLGLTFQSVERIVLRLCLVNCELLAGVCAPRRVTARRR